MTVQPPPDDKDWTWVLTCPCPECGLAVGDVPRAELDALATDALDRWQASWDVVSEPARRPSPRVWSPLEYACHVRDELALAVFRTTLMRTEDDPAFENWDQDATALQSDYASTDPVTVGPALAREAAEYLAVLATVRDDEWSRPGRRSNGSVFTVESFTRYLLHDVVHHLTDITGRRWA